MNIIEQMFEGLKPLQEKDLFEIILKQKASLDQEFEDKPELDIPDQ